MTSEFCSLRKLLLPLTLALSVSPAVACNPVDQPTVEDDFDRAEEVFVARLASYSRIPDPDAKQLIHESMTYELIHALRGRPSTRGVVWEKDVDWERDDIVFDSCRWSVLGPNAEGKVAILLVRNEVDPDGLLRRWVQLSSSLHAPSPHSESLLEQLIVLSESNPTP